MGVILTVLSPLYSAGNVLISDELDEYIEMMSKVYGVSGSDFVDFPSTWIGSGAEVREKLKHINEETGISCFQFFIRPPNMTERIEKFSEQVVKHLK